MPGRLFAIGDIHGCSKELKVLIEAINPNPEDTIVTLGDVIDWGPDSRGVVQQLLDLAKSSQVIQIMGNHEEMLFNALESRDELRFWLKCGGEPTRNSYGVTHPSEMPQDHVEFLRKAKNYYETETHIFVHANYWPNRPMCEQTPRSLREDFFDPKDAAKHFSGKTVVAGHTPQENGEVLDLGFVKLIDTDCSRGGWLTALEVRSSDLSQANEKGEVRCGKLVVGAKTPGTRQPE